MDESFAEERQFFLDDLLQELRYQLIGGHLCLGHGAAKQHKRIRQIATQLTFCYARTNPEVALAELRALSVVAPAVLRFMLHAIESNEQTYGSLLRLLQLQADVLGELLQPMGNAPRHIRRACERALPYLTNDAVIFSGDLERALLLLLLRNGRLPSEQELRQRVSDIAA